MRHCRYTTRRPEGDVVDHVALRLRALWAVITAAVPAAVDGDAVLADDRLLDWAATAGSHRRRH
ncbi:hypothetical protein JOF29_000043 [Kribbella aluminosa]|uniref:Uncharacterized protein n=1 Tax=Kribbella aluminosa TaxID=416017 RepID=A0ABS4UBI5_9ACTN|nr:hypothetical protein [Kribbella aluminosa]MBP2348960.1 hypothetical protein [Kribbella aluminosa]